MQKRGCWCFRRFCWGGYLKAKKIIFIGDYVLRGVLGLTVILLVVKALSWFNLGNKAINVLGSISYEVYLTHGLVISTLTILCGDLKPGAFILSSVIVTIIVSYIVHLIDLKIIQKLRVSI